VHPDVVEVDRGFLGHRYLLAFTPYPAANDRLENPSLRVSDDGLHWRHLPGCPDPLVPAPLDPDHHHADPDLVLHGGRLYLYYITRSRTRPHVTFSMISTTDGRVWSAPTVLVEQEWGVSPAVVRTESGWSLYYVHADLRRGAREFMLRRRIGHGPHSFTEECSCEVTVPGHHPWHIDVIRTDAGFEALLAAFPAGTDPSRSRLFHLTSGDGVRFATSQREPVLRPSRFGWDDRMIYRSTFVQHAPDDYTVWYSAASWGMHCGIGIVRGPMHALRPLNAPAAAWRQRDAFAKAEFGGMAKYLVLRLVPSRLLARLRPGLRGAAARSAS
jgi:hypothetical protein